MEQSNISIMDDLLSVFFRNDLFYILKNNKIIELYHYCNSNLKIVDPENYIRFYNDPDSYCIAEIHRDRVYKYETYSNKQLALAIFICFGYGFYEYTLYGKTLPYKEKESILNRFNELYEKISQYVDITEYRDLLKKYFISPKTDCPYEVLIER